MGKQIQALDGVANTHNVQPPENTVAAFQAARLESQRVYGSGPG